MVQRWTTASIEPCENGGFVAYSDYLKLQQQKMFQLDDETRFILGLPNFRTGPMAHRLRELGHDIKTKCEDEQAYVIHWLLTLHEEHGAEWRNVATNYLALPIKKNPYPIEPSVNRALNNEQGS